MLFKLILLFTLGPLIEIFILIEIGRLIGSLETIALVVLTGVVGAALAKTQGLLILRRIQEELYHGELPGDQLLNGLCVLVGGVLFITPGIISDILGFLLIVPASRIVFKEYLKRKADRMLQDGTFRIWWR